MRKKHQIDTNKLAKMNGGLLQASQVMNGGVKVNEMSLPKLSWPLDRSGKPKRVSQGDDTDRLSLQTSFKRVPPPPSSMNSMFSRPAQGTQNNSSLIQATIEHHVQKNIQDLANSIV